MHPSKKMMMAMGQLQMNPRMMHMIIQIMRPPIAATTERYMPARANTARHPA
jgi:hypothetical protein